MCGLSGAKYIEMCSFSDVISIEKCEDALSAFVKNEDYHVKKAYVLSNTREITTNGIKEWAEAKAQFEKELLGE